MSVQITTNDTFGVIFEANTGSQPSDEFGMISIDDILSIPGRYNFSEHIFNHQLSLMSAE